MAVRAHFFDEIIELLAKMEGISRRQAEKIVFQLARNADISAELANKLQYLSQNVKTCTSCHILNDRDLCSICADQTRKSLLVVVETSLDVVKFEEIETFRPYYYVLGGLARINRQKKLDFSQVNVTNLKQRARKYDEIILALAPNMQGIVTVNYLRTLLNDVKVTQLASGIPLGGGIDYIDKFTLQAALNNRKEPEAHFQADC